MRRYFIANCRNFSSHDLLIVPLQIVREDRTLEPIVFPIPEICEYLTPGTKVKVYATAERDEQGSKVADFFDRYEDMFAEMSWQKKLRTTPYLCKAAQHMGLWSTISFNFAVLINILVAVLYPFSEEREECKPSPTILLYIHEYAVNTLKPSRHDSCLLRMHKITL